MTENNKKIIPDELTEMFLERLFSDYEGEGSMLSEEKKDSVITLMRLAVDLDMVMRDKGFPPVKPGFNPLDRTEPGYTIDFIFRNPLVLGYPEKNIISDMMLVSDICTVVAPGYYDREERLHPEPEYDNCVTYTFTIKNIWKDWRITKVIKIS